MQVQSTTNKQNSNPAFGRLYKFSGRNDLNKEIYRILQEKGAEPVRDFIGGVIGHKDTMHLATGMSSFYPPFGMPTNGLFKLGDKVKKARKRVIEITLDSNKSIEEQLNITLRRIRKNGKQEIVIEKK